MPICIITELAIASWSDRKLANFSMRYNSLARVLEKRLSSGSHDIGYRIGARRNQSVISQHDQQLSEMFEMSLRVRNRQNTS